MHILSDFAGRQNVRSTNHKVFASSVTPTDLSLSILSLPSYDGTQLLHVQLWRPYKTLVLKYNQTSCNQFSAWAEEVGAWPLSNTSGRHPCYWPLLENAKSFSSLATHLGYDCLSIGLLANL